MKWDEATGLASKNRLVTSLKSGKSMNNSTCSVLAIEKKKEENLDFALNNGENLIWSFPPNPPPHHSFMQWNKIKTKFWFWICCLIYAFNFYLQKDPSYLSNIPLFSSSSSSSSYMSALSKFRFTAIFTCQEIL